MGADRAQLLFHALIAAVQVVDAFDGGFAEGGQAGDDQAGRGAQVGGHDGGARQLGHARDDGGVSVDVDLGAHAAQLLDVHVAVLEDVFHDDGRAVGDGI